MEQIRAFIAIELPDRLKLELDQLEARLKTGQHTGVKWVKADSVHLTLKFLGNIAGDRTSEITGAMAEAAEKVPPFNLEVRGLGVFPNIRRAQVAWVGLSGEVEKAVQLQQYLESNLSPLGFAPESRKFTPHLTIARLRNQVPPGERQRFGQMITGTSFEAGTLRVDAISLMRSQLTRDGAIYSRLSSASLRKPLSTANA